MYIENSRKLYLRDDIIKIDKDILSNIQRYDLIKSLSDAGGVEFNIYWSKMENWLKKQWQCKYQTDFYEKIAIRFNSSYKEMLSSGNFEQCFLICFLEHFKELGHDAYFDLYSEAVLNIDGHIIDNINELTS
ncbi:hypothetical protein J3U21_04685 [Gilliamella sp. B2776]|uniref:hypothetical protein n=1 Tax=unclassified Gilliamella TaxID=2685620 RepID=UPI00226A93D8|nr:MULTISPECIES: hypothetical protein [unclassified Gilliamella]MCX8578687.1 hypothetical protein [Gilliamella sp. B2717]MCX8649569.1 hypothetical protein [Gilliamella sp. B2779]MCX8653856.1 hypothetical protein [Gilliamella sp. B2737]MCX8691441.1 hypothetical protein [Gilliamella sp. B2776]MCX8702498.1 hypothetical protein [Gilliamella sp. B2781]